MLPSTSLSDSSTSEDEPNVGQSSSSHNEKSLKTPTNTINSSLRPNKQHVDDWSFNRNINNNKLKRKGKNSTKREESLFSLKQFLKNDTNPVTHQYAGARPKVYESQPRTPEPNENHESGKYPRNPTELPDFVQDHLVIEQCYLSDKASPNVSSVEVDNLPDFALNSVKNRHLNRYLDDQWKKNHNNNSSDLSFDLTDHLDKSPATNVSHPTSLNFPKLEVINGESADVPESLGFPFDLQIPRSTESNSNPEVASAANNLLSGEGLSNSTKLLPDFLSDAPIRTRGTPMSDRPDCSGSNDSINHWLSVENERLSNELQISRRQAADRSLRIEALEAELMSRRHVNHNESANLEAAIEQVQDNLKYSRQRVTNAENTVTALREKIESLNIEIMILQSENRELREALEVENNSHRYINPRHRIQRLAEDLRHAATTAEVSLKQLMSGVNNLRVLASAIEHVDKIEDRTKDFLPDFDDEDNAAGPAL